jgi:Ras-related protein Rab-1A
VRIHIWDTAGQERFRTITSSYYRGAHGIMMVYDLTDRESFEHIKTWAEDIVKFASENVIWIIVGNKLDLEGRRRVYFTEAKGSADSYGVPLFEASAKTGDGVHRAFEELIRQILSKEELSNLTRNKSLRRNSQLAEKRGGDECCC